MNCTEPRTVHTIGHSTREIEDFTALVEAHAVTLVVDVRRWPVSRRYPHFRREALSESLRKESIDYLWREDLGGFRKPSGDSQNTAWKVGAFRAYADFMLTPEFEMIMPPNGTAGRDPTDRHRVRGSCSLALPSAAFSRCISGSGLLRTPHYGRWLSRASFAAIRDSKRNTDLLSGFSSVGGHQTAIAL
jgi:hypothetical protein